MTAGLRWLAVLPAGLLAVVLVQFPLHWGVLIATADDGESFLAAVSPETLERLGTAFVTPAALIYFGGKVAPSYRTIAASVLAALYSAAIVAVVAYVWGDDSTSLDYRGAGWIEAGIAVALGITGIGVGVVSTYREDADFKISLGSSAQPPQVAPREAEPEPLSRDEEMGPVIGGPPRRDSGDP